ncbi:MAG: inositol monophosphatase family protein [Pseudomonadota bacterium]
MDLSERLKFAKQAAIEAGKFAHEAFRRLDTLTIESKGHHDLVSQADRDTETRIRKAIADRWPEDGIVGEEHGRVEGTTGFDWIIDPIDGTANYVSGIPHWCVVIACAKDGVPILGVIFDPNTNELFEGAKGEGAFVNGKQLRASEGKTLSDGSVATGCSGRSDQEKVASLVRKILVNNGMYFRSASGALMLAYVASGRLLGYIEDHMNSWDCFAALVMIKEAGGTHAELDASTAMIGGTKVVAGGAHIFETLDDIATSVFD